MARQAHTIHPHCALHPTARLQMLLDLFCEEWSVRSHKLGLLLWPIYFPKDAEPEAEAAAAAAAAPAGEPSQLDSAPADDDGLVQYERDRLATVAANLAKLRELGFCDKEKSVPQRRPVARTGPPAPPLRSSARVALMPGRTYSDDAHCSEDGGEEHEGSDAAAASDKAELSDDDHGSGSSASAELSDDDYGSSASDDGGDGATLPTGCRGRKGRAANKAKAARAKAKGEAELPKKKRLKSGPRFRLFGGGAGFECPGPGCESVFGTAKEALEHGVSHGLTGERVVDAAGESCCMWQGCGKKLKVVKKNPNQPGQVRLYWGVLEGHEAKHIALREAAPVQGFVCPVCADTFPTSADAWACCAALHNGGEVDTKKCLWSGCVFLGGKPYLTRIHEAVRGAPLPSCARRRRGSHTVSCRPPKPLRSNPPPTALTPMCVADSHRCVRAPLQDV